jgi:hypothetical protein
MADSCMVGSMGVSMMEMVSTVDSMARLLDSMVELRVGFIAEVLAGSTAELSVGSMVGP